MLLLASEPLRWYCILLTSQRYYRQQRLLFTTCNVMLYQLMMSLVSCRVVILLTEMKKQAERTRKKRCSQIAKIQQTHIKLQCHKITNPSEIQTNTRKKMKWQFQSYIDKIRWHTTNYVNFSTIKKTAMLEKDTVSNWDRMWSLNGQWLITCSSVCSTPHGHSLSSLGLRLYLPVSMANLCDDNLLSHS